jgi:hypothetical protein
VEDVVYLPMRGQLNVIDAWADDFRDAEGPEVFGVQLCSQVR